MFSPPFDQNLLKEGQENTDRVSVKNKKGEGGIARARVKQELREREKIKRRSQKIGEELVAGKPTRVG